MTFKHMNNEIKCYMLVGTVFLFFIASSAISYANADPIQWADDPGQDYSGVDYSDNSAVMPGDGDKLIGVPPNVGPPKIDGPETGSPNIDGPKEVPPLSWFSWQQIVRTFFTSILVAL